jgi:hypothetical protein
MLTPDDLWVGGICLGIIILLVLLGNIGSPPDEY